MSVATSGAKRKERDFDPDDGEATNINVVVRCRGRNAREVKENSAVVVKTEATKGKTVELSMGPNSVSDKTYNFDHVFSQAADQAIVFEEVVKPVLDEVSALRRLPEKPTDSARCSRATTAPFSPTAKPVPARRTPCQAT